MTSRYETYTVLVLCTNHVTYKDSKILYELGADVNFGMVTNHDVGWFIKLYDESVHNYYPTLSAGTNKLLLSAFNLGFRMIEFTRDADSYVDIGAVHNW